MVTHDLCYNSPNITTLNVHIKLYKTINTQANNIPLSVVQRYSPSILFHHT